MKLNVKVNLHILILILSVLLVVLAGFWSSLVFANNDRQALFAADEAILTPFNSPQWRVLGGRALSFDRDIDAVKTLPGQTIYFYSKNVTFAHEFNGITRIAPDGKLYFSRQTPFGKTSLLIAPGENDFLGYQLHVDDQLVVDQWAARQFISQIFSDVLGEGVHRWKVSQLTLLQYNRHSRYERQKTNANKLEGKRLLNVIANEAVFFTPQEVKLAKAILNSPQLLRKRPRQYLGQEAFEGPFFLAIISADGHKANVLENGQLSIATTRADGVTESTTYQLDNDTLYQLFADVTGKPYVQGETEQQMVKFFIRMHFQLPDDQVNWLM